MTEKSSCSLFLGDCLEVMQQIPDSSVDMVLVDLPYGTTSCSWDSVLPFDSLWKHYMRVCRKNAAIVMTSVQPFTTSLIASNMKAYKYSWTWVKHHATGHLNAKKRPMKLTEDISVFSFGTLPYYPQGVTSINKPMKNSNSDCSRGTGNKTSTVSGGLKKEYVQTITGYPRNVLNFKSENANKDHPTQKPVALMEYLIRTYTTEGQTVLDNCMGSGTTGVACAISRRSFIGIELDPTYFGLAKLRIEDAFRGEK